jgi:ribonuclease P protein component
MGSGRGCERVRDGWCSEEGARKAVNAFPSSRLAMGQKRRRLSRTAEFDRVYRHGRSTANRHLVLYVFPRDDQQGVEASGSRDEEPTEGRQPRLGVSVGRRVGGAVVRNRVKRLLREAFWSLDDAFDHGSDYVIVARSDVGLLAESDGLEGLRRSLHELAEKLGAERSGDKRPAGAGSEE